MQKTFKFKLFNIVFEYKPDIGIIIFIPTIIYFKKGYDIGEFKKFTNITFTFLIFGLTIQF